MHHQAFSRTCSTSRAFVACSGAGRASAIRRHSRPAAVSASTSNNPPQPRRVKGASPTFRQADKTGRAFPQKPTSPSTAWLQAIIAPSAAALRGVLPALPLSLSLSLPPRCHSTDIVVQTAIVDVALSHSQHRQLGLESRRVSRNFPPLSGFHAWTAAAAPSSDVLQD